MERALYGYGQFMLMTEGGNTKLHPSFSDNIELGYVYRDWFQTVLFLSLIHISAKWIMTARQYVLNIYTENRAYARPFKTGFG